MVGETHFKKEGGIRDNSEVLNWAPRQMGAYSPKTEGGSKLVMHNVGNIKIMVILIEEIMPNTE